jgi:hypothetical protein
LAPRGILEKDADTRTNGPTSADALDADLARFARRRYNERRLRDSSLGRELFGEAAWDILLDLYASELSVDITIRSNAWTLAPPLPLQSKRRSAPDKPSNEQEGEQSRKMVGCVKGRVEDPIRRRRNNDREDQVPPPTRKEANDRKGGN